MQSCGGSCCRQALPGGRRVARCGTELLRSIFSLTSVCDRAPGTPAGARARRGYAQQASFRGGRGSELAGKQAGAGKWRRMERGGAAVAGAGCMGAWASGAAPRAARDFIRPAFLCPWPGTFLSRCLQAPGGEPLLSCAHPPDPFGRNALCLLSFRKERAAVPISGAPAPLSGLIPSLALPCAAGRPGRPPRLPPHTTVHEPSRC